MASNEISTTTAVASMELPSSRSGRLPYTRLVQNFLLLWLDGSINETNHDRCCNTITKLRQIVNTVNTFTDVNECIDFITDIEEEKIFMIVSGTFSQVIVPIVQDIPQVSGIYIFCGNKSRYEQWALQWSKVKGVFTDITPICEALKQTAQNFDQNSVSISFIKSNDSASNQNLDQLDQSFMYTQILKEILLTIDFDQEHINEFVRFCREQFTGDSGELKTIDKLENEYYRRQPIWWYTCGSFLYSMLNRALRIMDVDLIVRMGFFVRDLHQHIAALCSEQCIEHNPSNSFDVYRGQGLSKTDFDQLMKTKGGLMSFNNFLSTALDREVSLAFAESNQFNPELIGILFKITVNPTISSTPFANIKDVSYYQAEEEILFCMHSVFRIGQVEQLANDNRLWEVELTLTSDNDPQLHVLTESISKETIGSTGWHRLGHLMIKLGHFDKAEELYETLLKQRADESENADLYHMFGQIKYLQGEYTKSVTFYEKSLEIYRKNLPPNHPSLPTSYSNIGAVYNNRGEYSKALSYYEKALEILQKTLPPNHPTLATSFHNIGLVYNGMGEYSKALSYYEKNLDISHNTLPPNHPHLATSYDNIGNVYSTMGEYSKALSYYEKVLEILQKTLPPNHPHLATSYNNIGLVYNGMGEYSKALSYYEKALEIRQKSLPPNHPDFAQSYNNIGSVYDSMGEYSKALSSHEKALEIKQKILPPNHPDVATSYNNIGLVYNNMGEDSKALSYYEKALEIQKKFLPPNHPHLATSYNNIGNVYFKMSEYSKALSYYEKDLDINHNTLPPNHPHLATSYNNIGLIYNGMGEFSKTLSYYKKALEIRQQTLPSNHPDLATSYNNIGNVYFKMSEYSKALSYYEKALEIRQKTLPTNHHQLATSYNNIGNVYSTMGDYWKAVSFFERAVNIGQYSLPVNYPNLQLFKDHLEIAKKNL